MTEEQEAKALKLLSELNNLYGFTENVCAFRIETKSQTHNSILEVTVKYFTGARN